MKTTAQSYYSTRQPIYPNAATRRELLHRVLDYLLVALSGAGIGAMVLLVLALT